MRFMRDLLSFPTRRSSDLQMVDQYAPGALHHALRLSRRARREYDVHRMVERQLLEIRSRMPLRRQEFLVADGAWNGAEIRSRPGVRGDDHAHERWDPTGHCGGVVERGKWLSFINVSIRGEEHLWLDLAEAVQRGLGADVGGAGRPDRADGRRGQHGHSGLDQIRHVAADPVARADADRAK